MTKLIRNSTAEFLIFTNQTGDQSIEVRYENGEIWLTQKRIAELFECSSDNVSLHLKNIFKEGELDPFSVTEIFSATATDGKNYNTKHYNLDAVISVGYRVNSVRATQFRQWVTQILCEFSMKGYVLDRERMENGTFLGEDYFERLLEEIRGIRLSKRRARWQIPMAMEDWAKRLAIFLNADDLPILDSKGKISFDEAKLYVETEFEKYRVIQDRNFESDFERLLKSQSEN
ncbi:hypothetical protein CFY87_02540 [Actinobacillus seminis]|uniref:DNA-binding protein n=1 Tax=Actinobacillus seminis TaxID=722 RepID=A0A263HDI9_9PAST|nr:RhuM family protein [Actinobacillus seminis]OZN25500.1 hypothetical protein CFY87_02540 [Actinobacillus seminis]SUU37927.1 DNA-binding protein [Actinobacillus seminis]